MTVEGVKRSAAFVCVSVYYYYYYYYYYYLFIYYAEAAEQYTKFIKGTHTVGLYQKENNRSMSIFPHGKTKTA